MRTSSRAIALTFFRRIQVRINNQRVLTIHPKRDDAEQENPPLAEEPSTPPKRTDGEGSDQCVRNRKCYVNKS